MAAPGTRRRHPLLWLYFGLTGRISRGIYWLAYGGIVALSASVVFQTMSNGTGTFYQPSLMLEPFLGLVTFYANIAIACKRLHDFGLSGRYALILLLPVVIAALMLATGILALASVAWLVNLAATIWFGIPPSVRGPNRYGASPNTPPG